MPTSYEEKHISARAFSCNFTSKNKDILNFEYSIFFVVVQVNIKISSSLQFSVFNIHPLSFVCFAAFIQKYFGKIGLFSWICLHFLNTKPV